MTTEAKPSATLILLRDGSSGLEVLYLRRNQKLAFHGGAWVFPGGRIDPEDFAGQIGSAPALEAAARRAAVREAREEAGLELEPSGLVPVSHWTTPETAPRRFATWFFAAGADETPVQVDGGEIHEHRWLRPEDALRSQAQNEIELPPPTFVTTRRLEPFATAAVALDALRGLEPETFLPRIHSVDGGMCSVYQDDAGYPDGDLERAGHRHRLWMLDSGWWYERKER